MIKHQPHNDGYLGYALTQAAHVWRAQLARELSDLHLTPPQFFVISRLYYLSARKGLQPTQKQLAEGVAMDANTASQVIRSLERRHLLTRSRQNEDKRAIAVSLSPQGKEIALKSTQLARQLNEQFFAASQQDFLYQELRQLINNNAKEKQ